MYLVFSTITNLPLPFHAIYLALFLQLKPFYVPFWSVLARMSFSRPGNRLAVGA